MSASRDAGAPPPDQARDRPPGTPDAPGREAVPADEARPGLGAVSAPEASTRQRTAQLSVVAALVLVAIKLAAGAISGSLGLVAEAAHSATDLVAALLTLFAVRVAVRPADREHHYGHGKAEHLAALAESAVLALVSFGIVAESVRRLVIADSAARLDVRWWTIAVLLVVIVIDLTRALASARAARRVDSAALAANALHFTSDLAGSIAVLVGLILVRAGHPKADAIAALFVAVLVVLAAIRLGRRSIDVLMDRASIDTEEAVRAVLSPLPVEVRRVRVRHAAGYDFVDLVIAVPPDAAVGQAHAVADAAEEAVHRALGRSDVVVHVEPQTSEGPLRERVTAAAQTVPQVREIHNVRVIHTGDSHELSLHVKLPPGQTLRAAHEVVSELETAIRRAVPEVRDIHTHIEPLSETNRARRPSSGEVADQRAVIDDVVRQITGEPPGGVRFRDAESGRIALLDIVLPADESLRMAHRRAGEIEEAVRERCPDLVDVVVHTEPAGESA
jgi:cation diffusion facilitator family transporter